MRARLAPTTRWERASELPLVSWLVEAVRAGARESSDEAAERDALRDEVETLRRDLALTDELRPRPPTPRVPDSRS